SVGMACAEMGNWAKAALGATDGVNLDGGVSSTMVVNGVVKNVPSGGYERGVCNGVMMVNLKPKTISTALANSQNVSTLAATSLRLGPGTNFYTYVSVSNG